MSFAQLATNHWQAALEQNFLAAVELIQAVLPGTIMTDRLRELGPVAETLIASVPAGRVGTPVEFSAACAFLCSEAAGFIRGSEFIY